MQRDLFIEGHHSIQHPLALLMGGSLIICFLITWRLYFTKQSSCKCSLLHLLHTSTVLVWAPRQCHSHILGEPLDMKVCRMLHCRVPPTCSFMMRDVVYVCMGDYGCLRVHPGSTLALHTLLWPWLTLFLHCHWFCSDLLSHHLNSCPWCSALCGSLWKCVFIDLTSRVGRLLSWHIY